jgi:hypothetical protein
MAKDRHLAPAGALLALAFLFGPASSAAAAPPVTVYVADVAVDDPALAADAKAVGSSLCSALARDKRVDVLCAADVKQLMSFAASSSLLGVDSPATSAIERRLQSARFVVLSRLAREATGVHLTVTLGPQGAASGAAATNGASPVVTVDERSSGAAVALLERLPALCRRLVEATFAPQSADPTVALPPPPLTTTTTTPTTVSPLSVIRAPPPPATTSSAPTSNPLVP